MPREGLVAGLGMGMEHASTGIRLAGESSSRQAVSVEQLPGCLVAGGVEPLGLVPQTSEEETAPWWSMKDGVRQPVE